MEVRPFGQNVIRLHGSRRATLRNRKFIRRLDPLIVGRDYQDATLNVRPSVRPVLVPATPVVLPPIVPNDTTSVPTPTSTPLASSVTTPASPVAATPVTPTIRSTEDLAPPVTPIRTPRDGMTTLTGSPTLAMPRIARQQQPPVPGSSQQPPAHVQARPVRIPRALKELGDFNSRGLKEDSLLPRRRPDSRRQ